MGVVLAIALVSSSVARAESALRLPVPSEFARIPASTYDAEGRMLGDAQLVTERLENGHVRMAATTGIAGGPRTVASAELAPIDGESALRLLSERSQSYDFQGNALVLLEIDHRRGTARCTPPGSPADRATELPLPSPDRVANVPMILLFRPLVEGAVDSVEFQLFVCRGEPRFWDFEAKVVRRDAARNGDRLRIVEVRYGPDLGPLLSVVARFGVPHFSFWFDAGHDDVYLGHRLPLYTKGPLVFVVRDGMTFEELAPAR